MGADFQGDAATDAKLRSVDAFVYRCVGVVLATVLFVGYVLFRDVPTRSAAIGQQEGETLAAVVQSRILNPKSTPYDERGDRVAAGSRTSFLALQNLWDTVWTIDAAAAEVNEANIVEARALREQAERGDLEATVLLLGAAGWCVSAGPLSLQQEGTRGVPSACLSRFGADIDSRESLDRAIFRWTMQLANAGLPDATLYASVLGREQFFVPQLAVGAMPDGTGQAQEVADMTETLRSQLIGQLQSMVSSGSADAASELNSYYLRPVSEGEPDAALARHYARVTELLDPARNGLVELTETWIRERATSKRQS